MCLFYLRLSALLDTSYVSMQYIASLCAFKSTVAPFVFPKGIELGLVEASCATNSSSHPGSARINSFWKPEVGRVWLFAPLQ